MTKKPIICGLVHNLRRRYSTERLRRISDEGDWQYHSEWWGTDDGSNAPTVFRSVSDHGNGTVSVRAHPSSRPEKLLWRAAEEWLQRRYAEMNTNLLKEFGILGYQWRTLHFNEHTQQSTVKVMVAYDKSDPTSVFLMQQPCCLAVPYVKSMISAGLATISSCNYDLISAVRGRKTMNILCIGHGGGSIPLFLANNIQGARVDIVEIDPVVISASTEAMGFPPFSVMKTSGEERACSSPDTISQLLWEGIHERLQLHESDAEKFISDSNTIYDMVFIDAYDGEDIFPNKLWNPDSQFLRDLGNRLHPDHGTVVVNLHSDVDLRDCSSVSPVLHMLPMGKYVSRVCRAYRDALLGSKSFSDGLAYTVSAPWVCNTSLVVSRGCRKPRTREFVLHSLASKSDEVENVYNLPFSSFEYLVNGFTFVD